MLVLTIEAVVIISYHKWLPTYTGTGGQKIQYSLVLAVSELIIHYLLHFIKVESTAVYLFWVHNTRYPYIVLLLCSIK